MLLNITQRTNISGKVIKRVKSDRYNETIISIHSKKSIIYLFNVFLFFDIC